MLWSPCAFTIHSHYMRTHSQNKNVFVVYRHVVLVCARISRQYMTIMATRMGS